MNEYRFNARMTDGTHSHPVKATLDNELAAKEHAEKLAAEGFCTMLSDGSGGVQAYLNPLHIKWVTFRCTAVDV